MKQADIVIVGGGPAGISTALFALHEAPQLAGRIEIFERDIYPREKFCAGAIGARAERLLSSIGVHVHVPSVPIHGVAYRTLSVTRKVRHPGAGRVIRRIEFDAELAAEAKRRGAVLREGIAVTKVRPGSAGVEVMSSAGSWLARAAVGADGVRGVVRRSLGFQPHRYRAQAIEVDTEPVAADLEREFLFFDITDATLPGYYWDFPTLVGGCEMVCRGVYLLSHSAKTPRVEIQGYLAQQLARRGLDLRQYKRKRYAERGFEARAPLSVPRVLLAGEAAGIDPVTGEGIAQAIQYGAVAGRYLARCWRQGRFDFSGYQAELARSSVGRDLRVRERAVQLFYGPERARAERYLQNYPEFVQVGLAHFAGAGWPWRAAARAARGATSEACRWVLRPG